MPSSSGLPSLIGVIHLPPLPGSPGAAALHPAEALELAGQRAVEEARIFERAGFDGLILENFGDVPFYKDCVPPETIAAMAVIAAVVRQAVRIPLGINVLRNDARAGLAIAASLDCAFFRVNVLSGLAAADQGLLEGRAAELLRERDRLGARPAIFADVHVKHAVTLSSADLAAAVEDTAKRALADAVIISGLGTGKPVAREVVEAASRAARGAGGPLYLGSGVTADNLAEVRALVDGVIVSSDLRRGGRAGQPLEFARAQRFARSFRSGAPSAKRNAKARSESVRSVAASGSTSARAGKRGKGKLSQKNSRPRKNAPAKAKRAKPSPSARTRSSRSRRNPRR